jgi:hypothetical protein
MQPLAIPPAAQLNANSVELLRLWAVPGSGQEIILRHDAWKDPAAWGLALADVARHVARAHAQDGKDEGDVFQRIVAGLRAELEAPTDKPTGTIL